LVVTNYSYWLHIYKYGEGLGYFDTVVLDEAHNAPDELSKFLSIEIERHEIEGEHPIVEGVWPSPAPTGVSAWKLWASPLADQAEELLETIRAELSINPLAAIKRGMSPWKLRGLSSLARRLRDLASIAGEWVVETGKKGGKVKFDPIWAAPYADMLFRGSTKVVLASATIRPKTGQLIGINPQDLDFMECPSTFPKENRPFIWVPTVRLSSNSTDGDLRLWLDRIDEIVGQRLDRKGIIHTVSYARRDLILEHSIHAAHMISHATESAEFTVSKFKTGRYRVLVSPSMATGWDFPGDECRYQIIAKVPFPDLRTPITRARMKKDSEYLDYLTAQQIVQTYGRGVRSPDDWCECIVVDDNCDWFIRKARKFLPRWFKEAIRPPVRIFDLAPLNPNGTERRA
jgi:Rad3-related DNA helicase